MAEQTEEKIEHKEGRPWTNVRTFTSFQDADLFRKNCLSDTTKHTKIKRQTNSVGDEIFVVKQRTIQEEPVVQERQTKKNKKKD